jgi:DNA-binding LytR/AlgR family response regulator
MDNYMKITCLIIEDDPNYREVISNYVTKIDSLQLIAACSNSIEAHSYISSGNIQLLFSDIQMEEMNGIEYIKSLKNPPLVIFITSYPKYALEGYDVEAVHFLEKPLHFNKFLRAVDRAIDRLKSIKSEKLQLAQPNKDHLFVSDKNQWIKLEYKEIIYIEAEGDFVNIITSEKKHIILVNLKNIEQQLPSDIFIRVHRFYIVNKTKISAITKDGEIMVNESIIPLGDTYKSKLYDFVLKGNLIRRSSSKEE